MNKKAKKPNFAQLLGYSSACSPAVRWIKRNGYADNLDGAWNNCKCAPWMIWLLGLLTTAGYGLPDWCYMVSRSSRLRRKIRTVANQAFKKLVTEKQVGLGVYKQMKKRERLCVRPYYAEKKYRPISAYWNLYFHNDPITALVDLATSRERQDVVMGLLRQHIPASMIQHHLNEIVRTWDGWKHY